MNYDNLFKWAASLILAGGWFALILLKVADRPEAQTFILFVQSSLIALGAHGLTVSGTRSAPPQMGESTGILPNGQPRPQLFVRGGVHLKILFALIAWAAFLGWMMVSAP